MARHTISADFHSISDVNKSERLISDLLVYEANVHKRIMNVTRSSTLWFYNTTAANKKVTLNVQDCLYYGNVFIKSSNVIQHMVNTSYMSGDSSAVTTFSDWTRNESEGVIDAWKHGALVIRRIVSVHPSSEVNTGTIFFGSGNYTDLVSIDYSDSDYYQPAISLFDVYRSNDGGVSEDFEGTEVFANIMLNMSNSDGLAYSPSLRVYCAADKEPTLESDYLDIGDSFGITNSSNLSVAKTVKIPGTWDSDVNYYFALYFSAGEEDVEGVETAPIVVDIALKASVPLFINENNNGVAIGQYSTATNEAPKFESSWRAYMYGGIAGVTDYRDYEQRTYGTWVDGKAIYRKTIEVNVNKADTNFESEVVCTDMDTAVEIDGVLKRTSDGKHFPLSFSGDSGGYVRCHLLESRTLEVRSTWPGDAYITVYYTKTTDDTSYDQAALMDSNGSPLEDADGYSITVASEEGTVRLSHTAAELDRAVDDTETLMAAFASGELKGEKGDKGDKGETGPAYILTDTDKANIVSAVITALPVYNGEVIEV